MSVPVVSLMSAVSSARTFWGDDPMLAYPQTCCVL
jgi:hypothetical protein